MVSVGDEMTNVRSGERFVWRATRASTAGEYCEFDLYLSPTAKVAAPHRHPQQEERFSVVAGRFTLTKGLDSSTLDPAEVGVIPPNVPHQWGNTSGRPAHVLVRLTPALHIEEYFAKFCAVAAAGRAGPTGLPRNPLQLAVLFDAYRQEFAFATDRQQRWLSPLVTVLAAVGRRLKLDGGRRDD